ncbi:alpha/beta hydrolase [Ramlibacter albus]|uniref:Dienelactone hydrolase family protein n=1 Tax=Ramlibacter albus TaxID=2079448 RepID=A0A923ME81_9BURK|nr:dienelactone hydrolase family protein [Ramlibacter albus]MBC5767387.1 dienelactone hydrolase family protein [Ramlibacter albus]
MAEIETLEAATGESPTASVIILHGLGADGNDFVPVAQETDLSAVGPVRYVFPSAPVRPVTINGGYRMRAWYDILGTESTGRQDEAGLRESLAIVEQLIAHEKERGIAANRIVVAGFSQGCAMALMTGVRHAQALAGIVGMSGYLPLAAQTAAERSPANAKTPIFLAHGTQDEIVVFERGLQSRDQLRALGYDVEWHEYPMGHSVCMEEIRDLEAFLNRVLKA